MKFVLRHSVSGRYYQCPGRWVRRADNALSFDQLSEAQAFSRTHQLSAQPVERLAPFMMSLLRQPPPPMRSRVADGISLMNWCSERISRFSTN